MMQWLSATASNVVVKLLSEWIVTGWVSETIIFRVSRASEAMLSRRSLIMTYPYLHIYVKTFFLQKLQQEVEAGGPFWPERGVRGSQGGKTIGFVVLYYAPRG